MATVNLTAKLIKDITQNVAAPFADRYKTAAVATREDSLKLYDSLLVTPEHVAMMKQVPDKWLRISRTIHMTHKLYVGHQDQTKTKLHYVQLDLPNDERFYDYSWTYEPISKSELVERTNTGWAHTDLTSLGLSKDYITPLQAICTERDQLVATVEKMLGGCKTLNQVEKVWPAIRKYVGSDILSRLDKKTERKRTARDVGITDEELQALSVHHIRQQMTA